MGGREWADALGGLIPAGIHPQDPRSAGAQPGPKCPTAWWAYEAKNPCPHRRHDRHRRTIAGAVKLLHQDGARTSIIAAAHGVLSDPRPRAVGSARSPRGHRHQHPCRSRESKPAADRAVVAPLLSSTIRAVFENGSYVTGLSMGTRSLRIHSNTLFRIRRGARHRTRRRRPAAPTRPTTSPRPSARRRRHRPRRPPRRRSRTSTASASPVSRFRWTS